MYGINFKIFNQDESFSDKRNLKGDCFLLLQDQDTGTWRIHKRKEETVPCPECQALVTCKISIDTSEIMAKMND